MDAASDGKYGCSNPGNVVPCAIIISTEIKHVHVHTLTNHFDHMLQLSVSGRTWYSGVGMWPSVG